MFSKHFQEEVENSSALDVNSDMEPDLDDQESHTVVTVNVPGVGHETTIDQVLVELMVRLISTEKEQQSLRQAIAANTAAIVQLTETLQHFSPNRIFNTGNF